MSETNLLDRDLGMVCIYERHDGAAAVDVDVSAGGLDAAGLRTVAAALTKAADFLDGAA